MRLYKTCTSRRSFYGVSPRNASRVCMPLALGSGSGSGSGVRYFARFRIGNNRENFMKFSANGMICGDFIKYLNGIRKPIRGRHFVYFSFSHPFNCHPPTSRSRPAAPYPSDTLSFAHFHFVSLHEYNWEKGRPPPQPPSNYGQQNCIAAHRSNAHGEPLVARTLSLSPTATTNKHPGTHSSPGRAIAKHTFLVTRSSSRPISMRHSLDAPRFLLMY